MFAVSIKRLVRKTLPRPLVEVLVALKNAGSRLPGHKTYIDAVAGKKGIEIGGPSRLFKTMLPLYQRVASLDGVNFSADTVWEGRIKSGLTFNYIGSRRGVQFISDATDLSAIPENAYDFLLSSNCLEHVANPIKALMEWRRVIKPGGTLILVLPNKASNFDHRRPTTSFEHLCQDYTQDISEHDLTHLNEILELHDLSMDPPAGDIETFRRRSLDNFSNRTLHHHIFDLDVMTAMLDYAGFQVVQTNETYSDFFALATKPT